VNLSGLPLIRRQQRALAKWVLALFCLVWVQAALLPCAMAIVPDGMAGAPEEHCAYCPPTVPADTHGESGVVPACAYPDQPQADARAGVAAPLALALPVVAYVLDVDAGDVAPRPDDARLPGRTGPALTVSYCRFLK